MWIEAGLYRNPSSNSTKNVCVTGGRDPENNIPACEHEAPCEELIASDKLGYFGTDTYLDTFLN